MAVTSDGIRTPDLTDLYQIVADLNTMASSIQTALEVRANTWVGTSTQRQQFTLSAPEGGIWVDTNGEKVIWVKQGTSWERVWPLDDTGWVVPSLASNTGHPGHGLPLGVRRVGGRVSMRGRISRINGQDYPAGRFSGGTPFTLQPEFRPTEAVSFATMLSGFVTPNPARVEFLPDGTLTLGLTRASAWVGFDGMYWDVD